jgi:hypothetical protein
MGRDLKLNPEKGGTYYKDSQGRFHLYDPVSKECLDGYVEGDSDYEPTTYDEMEAQAKLLHPEFFPAPVQG